MAPLTKMQLAILFYVTTVQNWRSALSISEPVAFLDCLHTKVQREQAVLSFRSQLHQILTKSNHQLQI